VVELLRELGSLRINEERANLEWEWCAAYPLEELVDDFIEEFHKTRS
jgi:nucleoside-diphosphate-sugar epimerase